MWHFICHALTYPYSQHSIQSVLVTSHALCELLMFGLCHTQKLVTPKLNHKIVKSSNTFFVNRQSQIYIKLRVSIYVFNLPKHFTLSVRFDLNTTTLAKFFELVNKKNQFYASFFRGRQKTQ